MEEYERSGQIFVAYKGNEINLNDIVEKLEEKNRSYNYVVKKITKNNVLFAKIIYKTYPEDRDPHFEESIITVNGYNQSEIEKAVENLKYSTCDEDRMQRLTNYLYREYNTDMFKKLKQQRMHFCTAVYDGRTDELVAGVTIPNNEYTHLYHGYTPENKEIMFSNSKEFLEYFCDEVHEMAENTYFKNGNFYTLAGKKINNNANNEEMNFIPKNRINADAFLESMNILLRQITDESVRSKIENNVNDYLNSDDPKKRIEDYLVKELDIQTQKKILKLINEAITNFSIENNIKEKLNEMFNTALEEYSNNFNIPVTHIVKLEDTVLGQTNGGFYHEKFNQILTQIQLDEPIMLIGPAGSGKNHAIGQIADALGKKMYYTNNASNEFKLTGFIDAGGNYRDTEFYKAFKNGGVFFLDEIDNSDPSALIVINSALANGYMAFPHETIDRHPDFRMVAAANTWGKGSDLQYVGRNALDAATLDRFDNIFFDYDRKLESALYPKEDVLEFMWSFRDAILEAKIPHVVSTRGIGKVYKKDINNIPVIDTLTSNVIKNLGQDDINTIIGSMTNISSRNKYFEGIKQLRLGR